MPIVQTVLDSLGTPPAPVCLDWAWQLRDLFGGSRSRGEVAAGDRQTRQLTWSDLQVDQNGSLKVISGDDHPEWSAEGLIGELLRWSQSPDELVVASALVPSGEILAQRTIHFGQSDLPAQPADSRVVSDLGRREEQRSQLRGRKSSRKITPASAGGMTSRVASRKRKSPLWARETNRSDVASKVSVEESVSPKSESPRGVRQFKDPWRLMTGAMGGLLVGIVGLVLWTQQTSSPIKVATGNGPELESAMENPVSETPISRSPASEPDILPGPSIETNSTDAGSGANAEIQLSNSFDSSYSGEMPELAANDVDLLSPSDTLVDGSVPLPVPRDDPVSQIDSVDRKPLPDMAGGSSLVSGSEVTDARESTAAMERPPRDMASDKEPDDDVMSALATVIKQSEAAGTDEDLLAGVDVAPGVSQPPILMATYPMLQIQRIPTTPGVRARKPGWRLRLETSDGFVVEPADAQIISGREVASWKIREEEAGKTPRTEILVQAQLVGGRGAAIRWRIVAGAEDLPLAYVPLGKQYLDGMQSNLSLFNARLQAQIDRLKLTSQTSGLPSELKSALSKERRGYETQLKLSARILEIVADANQLEGWMDGQLEVHAQFIDVSAQDSTPLLQFGQVASDEISSNATAEDDDSHPANEKPSARDP